VRQQRSCFTFSIDKDDTKIAVKLSENGNKPLCARHNKQQIIALLENKNENIAAAPKSSASQF